MRSPTSKSEMKLRREFDFSKGTRGKYFERYQQGHQVVLLEDESKETDPAALLRKDSQLTEIAGRHLLIAHLINAGFEVAEPLRDNGIDLVAYRGREGSEDFIARPIQMKAFSHESFYLERKYERFPRLLIAYVWNVETPEQSAVYALTFEDAVKVLEKKGYSQTESWIKDGRYFVRNAGQELKGLLEPFRMTRERWQEMLKAA